MANDLVIDFEDRVGHTDVTIDLDFKKYNEHLQRVLVYLLLYPMGDTGDCALDMIGQYNSGATTELMSLMDEHAQRFLQEEVDEGYDFVDTITLEDIGTRGSLKLKIYIKFTDGESITSEIGA